MVFCTEAGLYRIIFSVQKNNPVAGKFQHWVFHEVLPSIRKTGQYTVAPRAMTEYDLRKLALEERKMALEELKLFASLRGTGDDIMRMTIENRLTNMIAGPSSTAVTVTMRTLKPLSQVLEDKGFSVGEAGRLARRICRAVAKAFRATHGGENPPKADMRVNGRIHRVNQYCDADWDLIEVHLPRKSAPPTNLTAWLNGC